MAVPIPETVQRVRDAPTWDDRVEEIRRVPEIYGEAQRRAVYAAIAEEVYVPQLVGSFAFVLWPDPYGLEGFEEVYEVAREKTDTFARVDPDVLAAMIEEDPRTVRVLRAIVGYTPAELEAAVLEAGRLLDLLDVRVDVKALEAGRRPGEQVGRVVAEAVHRLLTGALWDEPVGDFVSKLDKPDTAGGWETVRRFAEEGVPYSVLLHQRHYGGAFRTLVDATSTRRGDVLEDAVDEALTQAGIPHLRTGAHNQREIAERFNLTVQPAPDFVIFQGERTLRAMIESKLASDGGTARDKAGRFGTLAAESRRLGGTPLFAVLDGLGWKRTADALGPVVRDTDGRVFSVGTLDQMLEVQPFPGLVGLAESH